MLVLINGTLIDGTGREPVNKATVVIEGNRITDVGTNVKYPEKATVVDLKGLVIMPGLMDLHVHCGGIVNLKPGKPNFVDMEVSWKYADTRELSIANGVTTTRSTGDFFPDIVKVRDEIAAGKLYGPRFFVTGMQFQAPGGHPGHTIMGGDKYTLEHSIREVDDPKKARDEVKKLIEGGVDFIKTQLSSMDIWNYPRKVPKLRLDVLDAIVDEAHKHNHRVISHAESTQDAFDAVKSGADSIEHTLMIGAEPTEILDGTIEMMLKQGTYIVPTFAITATYDGRYPGVPLRLEILKKNIKRFYDAGVNIATGTDAGAPDVQFGEATHLEMKLMVEAGMSPMDTIVSTTKKAAENLGKGKELGTIEKGKLADIIVVDGNPVKNITDAKNIRLVMKDGKIMLDKLLA